MPIKKISGNGPQSRDAEGFLDIALPAMALVEVLLKRYAPGSIALRLINQITGTEIPVMADRTRMKIRTEDVDLLRLEPGVEADVKVRELHKERFNNDPPPPPRDASDHLLARIRERAMAERNVGRETFQADQKTRYELDDDAPEYYEEEIVQVAQERAAKQKKEREDRKRKAAEQRQPSSSEDHSDPGDGDPGPGSRTEAE